MSSVQSTVSDMMVTVKSREVQRGMLAEMGSRPDKARRAFSCRCSPGTRAGQRLRASWRPGIGAAQPHQCGLLLLAGR